MSLDSRSEWVNGTSHRVQTGPGQCMQAAPYVCSGLWTRPVSILAGLFSPLIKQDRRSDRRETFVDSAKCQERSIRAEGSFTTDLVWTG
ncbi:uncharacterized protein N7473_012468 [Penicillium subrubescens]|uniref:uncharacterized protein n=1 Tax=Penicillium subrubescens TaxID=1316194 RepID=UPI0025457727|nr:uncharacterized protein N7473_012468 [Penicillium subrubescens]KAJ5875121.1 hypothetical protein N7473_012468 [Penicillium subrubescens]